MSKDTLVKFALFKKMVTPFLIQVFFWFGFIMCIVGAIYSFAHHSIAHGLEVLILVPILLRVFCEFLIILFRIHQSLTDLKNTVQEKR